ncbi:MAG: hypothetical protein LBR60_04480 [Fibrobacter sp.]|jgi:hypothetical protein|nr:hypothetical protein [Fibrobacter sp.]
MNDLAYNSKADYTWVEAKTACPPGWHLPTSALALDAVWSANKKDFSVYNAAKWWSATEFSYDGTLGYYLQYLSGRLFRSSNIYESKTCNVRCVKD